MFFYGTLLPGERDHALLANAESLGPALTEPLYQLVELNVYAALVPDGKVAVHGELYAAEPRDSSPNRRQPPSADPVSTREDPPGGRQRSGNLPDERRSSARQAPARPR